MLYFCAAGGGLGIFFLIITNLIGFGVGEKIIQTMLD
jgi:hypothetical protein